MNKTKIIIAGIGGVGGYFGGLLARHFQNSPSVEISFIARGEHLKAIQNNGLTVINSTETFTAKPAIATNNPPEIGIANFIIIATKSYDLENVMHQLQPCIDRNTIILPLLNGIVSKEQLQKIYPDNTVLNGCVYIISRLKEPGIVENSGNIQKLYFGLDTPLNNQILLLEDLLKQAGVEAILSENSTEIIWEKFIFLSPTATATSYFDQNIGPLLEDDNHRTILMGLIEEITRIAKARKVAISEDIVALTMKKLEALPYQATSSMHTDIRNNKPNNELESLTGFIITEGQKYNVPTPTYSMLYNKLSEKFRK
ncbi:ketopantoate reductase family protein [Flavobacterium sp. '19STA2R22 D10 B1']|uniref:ketopantoate reductase family protein n=1 Tax=Flavobacterium aerium TaxID=3037261 RepID=UPI00278C4036|nr:2-dehydropantoate 2-reductase [Flavobacterium sp. '19STA2R22 D10 B1']